MGKKMFRWILSLILMTGLFCALSPVKAEEDAPVASVGWSFAADADISITVIEGETDYFSKITGLTFNCSDNNTFPLSLDSADISATESENTKVISSSVFKSNLEGLTVTSLEIVATGFNNFHIDNPNLSDDINEPDNLRDSATGYLIRFFTDGSRGTYVTERRTDADGILKLSTGTDSDILNYEFPNETGTYAEGWAYRPEYSQDVAFSMDELKNGVTFTGDTDLWPVKTHTVDFYVNETEQDKYASVKTTLIGTILSDQIPLNPTAEGKTFSSWYYLAGEHGEKSYINSLDGWLFNSDYTLYADWYSGDSDVTVVPSATTFGELEEGYNSPSDIALSITNTGTEPVTLEVTSTNKYFFPKNYDYDSGLLVGGNQTAVLNIGLSSGLTAGGADSKKYSSEIKLIDKNTSAPLASVTLSAVIKKNMTYHACFIYPNTNNETNSFEVKCPGTNIIQNISNDSLVSFTFRAEQGKGAGINPVPHRENDVMTVTKEQIIETGLYLDGRYVVSMTVDFNDHQDHVTYEFNNGEYVEMHTNHLVKKVEPDFVREVTVEGQKGIMIKALGTEGANYLKAAYDNMRVPGPMSLDYTSLSLENRNEAGHYQDFELANGENMTPMFIQLDANTLFIPDTILKYENVPNDTYGYKFHVPGYKDYQINYNDSSQSSKLLVITCGSEDPGDFYMVQNPDYSITIQAGTKPDSGESNFDILKEAFKGFNWTYDGSSRGWQSSDIIRFKTVDEASKTITLKFDPNDEDGLRGFYSYVYTYEHDIDTMTLLANNYAPGTVYSLQNRSSRSIHFKNPLKPISVEQTAYILGTKVLITTPDRNYLTGLSRIDFNSSRYGTGPGDWKMKREDWDFTDIKWNSVTQKWELSIPVTYAQVQKYTFKPLADFLLLTRNIEYPDVWSGPTENFKATAFVTNAQNAGENNLDPEELAELDADTGTEFHHVQFDGTVTSTDDTVDINGSIAGAITEEDTDLYHNEIIEINTSITEMSEEDKKDIMDYLNGHHLGEIKHAVDIKVIKTYPGQEPQVLSVLGVNTAIVFSDLPELQEGYEYIVITKHNGKIKLIPVTYKNGKLIAYTNEFSSFAITSKPKDDTPDKPDPTPAKEDSVDPSADPSVKPSDPSRKSESKKTSPIHIDNVVTCQMAGYPANYAWNESAKACQPGYLDENGVFHGTSVKKTAVPNTYDSGLERQTITFISTLLISFIAAYFLRKY